MAASIEKILSVYMRRSIQLGLDVDPSQTSIGAVKLRDSSWVNWPHYQVVPGAVRPDGNGRGAQEGGAIFRIQRMSVFLFTKVNTSEYSMTDQELLEAQTGTLDLFESLRQLFALTWFGQADGSQCLLSEPAWFAGEGQTTIEDDQMGLVSREFTWDCQYYANLPPSITIFQPAVASELD